jgi:hypothetical protein
MFFGEVQGYRHTFEKPGVQLNLIGKPEDTVVNEKDFSFPLATLDEMYRETITELFVAHNPLPRRVMLERSKRLTFVDDSFTRQPHISVTHYLLRRSFEVLRNEGPASWVGKVVNRLKG